MATPDDQGGNSAADAAVPAPFVVEIERAGDLTTLRVGGELDLATVGELERPLFEAVENGGGRILIDLSRCSFIDSTGIRVLLRAHRVLHENGGRASLLAIAGARGPVRRVLEMTGIADEIPIVRHATRLV